MAVKLNLGCGSQVPDGWINVDYALGARLAKIPFFRALNRRLGLFNLDWDDRTEIHDLSKRLPWQDRTVDVVYSSHTLEHFTREAGRAFLAECHRVLRDNGLIRIVVPDLAHIVAEYRAARLRADNFVEQLGVLHETTGNKLKDQLSPLIQFPHKCMYDTTTLVAVLNDIGFDAASRSGFDSAIADIREVELANRTEHAVVVEGRKR